jgi:hypothetical protein
MEGSGGEEGGKQGGIGWGGDDGDGRSEGGGRGTGFGFMQRAGGVVVVPWWIGWMDGWMVVQCSAVQSSCSLPDCLPAFLCVCSLSFWLGGRQQALLLSDAREREGKVERRAAAVASAVMDGAGRKPNE